MKGKNIAFIGLGVMGYPMAGHLSRTGHQVTVYNRTGSQAEKWTQTYTGKSAQTPEEAARNSDIVFVCVGNDDDVRSVIYGETGVLASLKPGSILVDHTTTSAQLAIELARACDEKDVHFIDAPVSGGQAGAENGALTVMCGGEPAVYDNIAEVIRAYAKHSVLLGGHGQGQRCKMVNQICIAGVLQGLSEALLLAEKSDLDIAQVTSALTQGAAGSWQMANRAVTMAADSFDFGFAIDWMRKDLLICLDEADRKGLTLPMTQDVNQRYQQLIQQGLGRMDTSVLIQSYKTASAPVHEEA
ncbi:NAD(P)-dependent oxidoreductase [Photobacterium galatheae]|uniref:2-hydroxy-3-oxopropionate reductase n=1 Tax=Photobacterium galatheae TaxID=1654360 RepID=A0A066RVQ8_9GAMM|nr:NAD(P)-dependent oxidoreductase [Photobacterium galatheae]KDM91772.1 2-hydroxy-3-oxopropionate reductase [Photobacterium galatheae]MCM0147134.1 NAD(P)-dependent oxidoreductase [Photobacterium galatheae]